MLYTGLPVRTISVGEVVAPTAQATVSDVMVDVADSIIDTLQFKCVSITIKNTGAETISWQVIGSNDAAFVVPITVQASADIAAAATSSYSSTTAIWRYYKVQVRDKVNAAHGEATVVEIMK